MDIRYVIRIHDELLVKGKRFKVVYILDIMDKPPDLRDTISFLMDMWLSNVDRMPEVLTIIEAILNQDRRFVDIAADMRRYRETVLSRGAPFTMIEARAILSKFRKWRNAIERVIMNDG